MRNSLDQIEKIEQYILGELNPTDTALFEAELKVNNELKQQVEIQANIIKVAKRLALRKQIASATKTSWWSKYGKWFVGGFVLLSMIAVPFFVDRSEEPENKPKEVEEVVESAPVVNPVLIDSIIENLDSAACKIDSAPVAEVNKSIEEFNEHDEIEEVTPASQLKAINFSEKILESPEQDSTPKASVNSFHGLKTWVAPKEQYFQIDPTEGATIEGEEGVLVIVPTNAFLDENDKVLSDPVDFKLVEALTLEDMVLYNLGTTSNGKSLETGGMLHFDFTCKGKKVKVNPDRPLYVEVPTEEVKPGMMAFKGEIENEKLNWVDPKPLQKYLVNVDFDLLDFLPEGFDDTVSTLLPYKGHVERSDVFTDSLYYSLGLLINTNDDSPRVLKGLFTEDPSSKDVLKYSWYLKPYYLMKKWRNSKKSENHTSNRTIGCGIDPLSIKSVKNKSFSKTFIATKEFEERVFWLHKTQDGRGMVYLNMYVNNLNKNLFEVDSMVAEQMLDSEIKFVFEKFAKEKLTNVKNLNIHQQQLSAFYNSKRKKSRAALMNVRDKLKKLRGVEISSFLLKFDQERITDDTSPARKLQAQLPKRNVAKNKSYSFSWASSGWVNIDAYLHLLSKGSIAVEMEVRDTSKTIEVYQWLNTIKNLTPLHIRGGQTIAEFPVPSSASAESMKNTFCFSIDIKDGNYVWFAKNYNPYQTPEFDIVLQPKKIEDIKSVLRKYDRSNHVVNRAKKLKKMLIEQKKRNAQLEILKAEIEVQDKLRKVAFPCSSTAK